MSMSASMSHGAPMSSAMGSPRGFSPDGRTLSASSRTFSPDGQETRVKGSNWKKPIDSDGGGPADPLPKPPKTQTSGGDGSSSHYGGPYGGGGWGHHPHYGPWGGPYDGNRSSGNVPQRDCRGLLTGQPHGKLFAIASPSPSGRVKAPPVNWRALLHRSDAFVPAWGICHKAA